MRRTTTCARDASHLKPWYFVLFFLFLNLPMIIGMNDNDNMNDNRELEMQLRLEPQVCFLFSVFNFFSLQIDYKHHTTTLPLLSLYHHLHHLNNDLLSGDLWLGHIYECLATVYSFHSTFILMLRIISTSLLNPFTVAQ